MKRFFECLVILAAAFALGVGSAMWIINHPPRGHGVQSGPWMTDASVGSAQADMYVRAVVARAGLFALSKEETIYYTAFTDDSGEPLRAGCDYTIQGEDMATRWWSITVYGQDHFLIPNGEDRYSFNMNNVRRGTDGRFKFRLSRAQKPGDWLPTAGEGNISLTLRLYNPSPAIYENLATTTLPRIVKEGCP